MELKKIINIFLVALLFVGAGLGGVALAGSQLDWELDAIENSTTKSLGASYPDFFCYVTDFVGNEDVILSLQGSGTNETGDNRQWVDMVNSTIENSTTAQTSPGSWQFQSLEWYARTIRMHVIGNTAPFAINGTCVPGGK